jgi:hypothetical protein
MTHSNEFRGRGRERSWRVSGNISTAFRRDGFQAQNPRLSNKQTENTIDTSRNTTVLIYHCHELLDLAENTKRECQRMCLWGVPPVEYEWLMWLDAHLYSRSPGYQLRRIQMRFCPISACVHIFSKSLLKAQRCRAFLVIIKCLKKSNIFTC